MKTCALVYGRMNPVTIGHALLIKCLNDTKCDEARLYLSKSQDKKNKRNPLKNENPLSYIDKISYIEAIIKEKGYNNVELKNTSARTVLEVLTEICEEGFDKVILLCGSDRVEDIENLVKKYNKDSTTNNGVVLYDFKSIEVIQCGKNRDKNSSDAVTSMSASKLRELACLGDWEEFRKGIPTKEDDLARQIYEDIRSAML